MVGCRAGEEQRDYCAAVVARIHCGRTLTALLFVNVVRVSTTVLSS